LETFRAAPVARLLDGFSKKKKGRKVFKFQKKQVTYSALRGSVYSLLLSARSYGFKLHYFSRRKE
jgi:hypothetical protein